MMKALSGMLKTLALVNGFTLFWAFVGYGILEAIIAALSIGHPSISDLDRRLKQLESRR